MSRYPDWRRASMTRLWVVLALCGAVWCARAAQAQAALDQVALDPARARPIPKANMQSYPGLGRPATAQEIAAWDIDVRPDFKGLPPGSGSVAKGQDIWESKCAHCHGIFGESNEVFSPLIGGTTRKDIESGRVANLLRSDYPGRTTLMKVATVSTLWDYINRAMPWNNPKTLTADEVYAVTAFMLNLAEVVPDDFVLSQQNIAEVQKRMPNRHGMQTRHAMWPGQEFAGVSRPDTQSSACMSQCVTDPKLASFLPEYARNSHGNLREQNRLVGPQRGTDTQARAASAGSVEVAVVPTVPAARPGPLGPTQDLDRQLAIGLIEKHACTGCHAVDQQGVGPSFSQIAKRHVGKSDYLAAKIRSGGQGVWGPIPMPAQKLPEGDAKAIAAWLAFGAGK